MKLEQAEQEPVAWVEVERGIPMFMNFADDYKPNSNNGIVPLYAAPVRTKDPCHPWQDLTDTEVMQTYTNFNLNELGEQFFMIGFARAVIAAYMEKNRGTA